MRALINDYNDCKLIMLDPKDAGSSLFVAQEGYDSADPACRIRVFYLQRDGFFTAASA